MRKFLSAIAVVLWSCGPTDIEESQPSLALIVTLEGEAKVRQPVKLQVRIKNISNRKVGAVRALDHSDTGWRYPIIKDEVRGPNGKIMTRAALGGCGNSDSILAKHVTVLSPGEEFDPFAEDPYGNNHVSGWIPYVEGRYIVALTIDYSAKDPAEWNGSIERRYADQEKVRQILALVPRVKLEAKAEFEVKQ